MGVARSLSLAAWSLLLFQDRVLQHRCKVRRRRGVVNGRSVNLDSKRYPLLSTLVSISLLAGGSCQKCITKYYN